MTTRDWARHEVELALRDHEDSDCYLYTSGCYRSALKAYESLADDDHSGMSFSITANILKRLLEHKPLTPITDSEDEWNLLEFIPSKYVRGYQCKRMPSLFKYVDSHGKVTYEDINRARGYDLRNPMVTYTSSLVSRIIDTMFPITLPYYPNTGECYYVATKDFLSDPANGDFDTVLICSIKTTDGTSVPVPKDMKYWGETRNGIEPISKEEFYRRYLLHRARVEGGD